MNLKVIFEKTRLLVACFVLMLFVQAVHGQNLKFNFNNVKLKEVLSEITVQTGFKFVYSDALDVEKSVSISTNGDQKIEEFCKKFFKSIKVNYKIEGKQILLSPEIENKKIVEKKHVEVSSESKNVIVTGKVVDANSQPLPFVTVQIIGNSKGTSTDIDGNFTIEAAKTDKLLFSFIGYKNNETALANFTTKGYKLYVVLEENAISLEGVVKIGYGTTQKIKDITGSISHIGKKAIETAPMGATVQSMLQGRAAGVNVQIQSASPTSPVSVIIRGQSSLSGDNQPLWIIDGIPEYNTGTSGSVSNVLYSLNLNDVESIDILKDVSSTAIYGSRAANGVVVVTTKRGKEGMKPTLEFSTKFGYQFMDFNGYDYFSGKEFINFTKKSSLKEISNRATLGYFTRQYIDESEYFNQNTSEVDINKIKFLPTAFYDSDTYWMGEMTQNPIHQQYDLTLRGGTKEVSYLASVNYSDMQGIVKTGYSKSFGGRIVLEARINKDLKMIVNATGNTRNASNKDGMLDVLKKIRPDIPVYNPDGTYFTRDAYTENPYTTLANTSFATGENISSGLELQWTIIKGLMFSSKANINFSSGESLTYKRKGSQHESLGNRSWSRTKSDTKLWDNTLTYTKVIGKHDILGSLTTSMERSQSTRYSMSANNFPDDDILNSFSNAAEKGSMGEGYSASSLLSQIARVQYKYNSRYLTTFTIRRDGSSLFGSSKKWGIFPSGGLGWIISDEKFMKNGWVGRNISHLKLRASYGKAGSQNLGSYQWLTLIGSSKFNGSPSIYPLNIGNKILQWEETSMTDLALEFELFDSRIRTTLGYFSKTSDNLIYSRDVPPSTGFTNYINNVASTSTHGYEFSLEADLIKNNKYQLTFNVNGSTNTSKILRFNSTLKKMFPRYSIIEEGGVIGDWYGFATYNRLFGSSEEAIALRTRDPKGSIVNYYNTFEGSGDIYLKDINQDGKITSDDRVVIGSSMPKMFGGFGLSFFFGGALKIDANFTYSYGNKRLWYMAMTDVGYVGHYNQSNKIAGASAILHNPYNPATLPNATPSGDGGNSAFSDYWLYDGSYIRLNSLNVNYRFGKQYFKNSLIDNIELSLQATNLFTLTKYPGFDPQGNFGPSTGMTATQGVDYSFYPSAKSLNFGVKFTFR